MILNIIISLLFVFISIPALGAYWEAELPDGEGEILYHFNESSDTTVYDASGNSQNASVSDEQAPSWESGMFSNALAFDGAAWPALRTMVEGNFYVAQDEAYIDIAWLDMWVQLDGTKTTSMQLLFIASCMDLWINSSGVLSGRVFDGSWESVNGTTVISSLGTEWVHISFKYDGTQFDRKLSLYINGVLEAENTYTGG
jgi:Concanavalin A-like lectin/glucanases superfamily